MSDLIVGGVEIEKGKHTNVRIPIGRLATQTPLKMRLDCVRGVEDGPTVWLSGTIHGDELNGFEIIRRVVELIDPNKFAGTLIAVPIVNVQGFVIQSRYVPDRRDLNRVFPGSKRGSMASRLAWEFMENVVKHCDVGIDLHTGPAGRHNLPQVRGNFEDDQIYRMAAAFAAPVRFHAKPQKGTVRYAAWKKKIPTLLYEGGEANRFDPDSISIGVDGILRTLHTLKMTDLNPEPGESREITKTRWVRARRSGVLRLARYSGEFVAKRERLGSIGDAMAEETIKVSSTVAGQIISHRTNPLVNRGDALIRLGY